MTSDPILTPTWIYGLPLRHRESGGGTSQALQQADWPRELVV